MLLAIDIGNTNIHSGIFKGKRLKKIFNTATHSPLLGIVYARKIKPYAKDIKSVIVVSVVPDVLKKMEKIIKNVTGKKAMVIGRDGDSGIKNLYRYPKQVGQDRLVNARAAYELYGGECIIADFGTAITIDIVNKKKEYIGGVIACGLETSLWALAERTALLPKVNIRKPSGILGRETHESMISGAVYGFSSLCDGIVGQFKKKYAQHATIVATGGFSRFIGQYCKKVDMIDSELTLKGLQLISEDVHV